MTEQDIKDELEFLKWWKSYTSLRSSHGDAFIAGMHTRAASSGGVKEVTVQHLMDELQVGAYEGEIYILHALAKKYPNGLRVIVEDKP